MGNLLPGLKMSGRGLCDVHPSIQSHGFVRKTQGAGFVRPWKHDMGKMKIGKDLSRRNILFFLPAARIFRME
jgi:hypothetical protein